MGNFNNIVGDYEQYFIIWRETNHWDIMDLKQDNEHCTFYIDTHMLNEKFKSVPSVS